MTGLWILLAAVALALGFGIYRARTDGRVRDVAVSDEGLIDEASLNTPLGEKLTFVQFSSEFCTPCRRTNALLTKVSAEREGVTHVELDVDDHVDLVHRFDVKRTPTVLILDPDGVVTRRIVGAPSPQEITQLLEERIA